MTETHKVLVSFNPLRIDLPGAGPFVGEIQVVLPENHVTVMDLSMGGMIPGSPHIGGDARIFGFKFEVPEPGMEAADLLKFIETTADKLEGLHEFCQDELDKRPLMGGLG